MSTIRPITTTITEAQPSLRAQQQTPINDSQFSHDLESKMVSHQLNHQDLVHESSHNKSHSTSASNNFKFQNSHHVSSSCQSKRVQEDDTSFSEEEEDSLSTKDDSDKRTDKSQSSYQSLVSHASKAIGQVIGMGLEGLSFGTNSNSSDADSVTFSGIASNKESSSNAEGTSIFGATVSTNNLVGLTIAPSGGDGSLGSSSMLEQGISKPVAAVIRSAGFSDSLLKELTASVNTLRLNSANGQDMTLHLRSDVLDATSIHITGNATHIAVDFSTTNAASNALLNAHLTTLQNHLAELCPGQVADIRTQFVPQSTSRDFHSDAESQRDDLASFDQGNRGFRNNDDSL